MERTTATRAGTAATLITILLGTAVATVPTPVYPIYAAELGLDTLGVTATFAVFALGALLGLSAASPLASRLSRQRVYVLAAVLQLAAASVLSLSLALPGFIAGRIITGLGAGLLAASGTALLIELSSRLPGGWATAVRALAPGSAYLGLALGPAIPAATAPATVQAVQIVFAVLAACIAATLTCSIMLLRPVGPAAAAGIRGRGGIPAASAVGAFAAFMTTGLFGAITPTLFEQIGADPAPALTGGLAAVVFAASAVGAVLPRRRIPFTLAASVLAVALPGVALALTSGSQVGMIAAGLACGLAGGALFARSLGIAIAATPDAAFRPTSLIFRSAYAGLSLPILGLGLAARTVPTQHAVWAFALLGAAVCLFAVGVRSRGLIRPRRGGPPCTIAISD